MELKFLNYSPEQLLEEKSFIDWVLRGTGKYKWKKFIEEYPEFRSTVQSAREIIFLLHDHCDVLDEDSLLEMWGNIYRYDQHYWKTSVRLNWKRWIRSVAALSLLLALGLSGYLFFTKEDAYPFLSSKADNQSNEARMVLPTGREITLNRDNSSILLNDKNEQVIVNDSIIHLSRQPVLKEKEVPMNEVVIPYGKRSELLLADGTKVWLNAGSRLAFPSKFTGKYRKVYLEGEACFKVTRNQEKPFIVKAGKVDVQVLGTLFDVSAYTGDEFIETVLLEGSVGVNHSKRFGLGKSEVFLKPSQKLRFNKKACEVVVTDEPNADIYIAWTEGWMQFSKESLSAVLDKLERYYNVEVSIPSHFPSSALISGKLDLKESLEDVMTVLADVARINYRISGNEIYIEKKMDVLPRQ
jgi:transmembrane sensor